MHLYKRLEASHIGHLTIRCHYACERSTQGDDHGHQMAKGRPADKKKPHRRAYGSPSGPGGAQLKKKTCRWICFFLLCVLIQTTRENKCDPRLRAPQPNAAAVSKCTRTMTSCNNNRKGRSTQTGQAVSQGRGTQKKKSVKRNCYEQCTGSGEEPIIKVLA